MPESSSPERIPFLAGLFLCTLATLALEVLDTRLLSATMWYHLSFFAVSTAMFGMSAGAVHVFLAGDRFVGARARETLAVGGLAFAASIPLCHFVNLTVPMFTGSGPTQIFATIVGVLALAVPFYLAGVLVTVSLTRIPGAIGVAYGVDLLGAGLGSLVVVPLLWSTNLTSSVLAVSAIAALGAACWQVFAGGREVRAALILAAALAVFAGLNTGGGGARPLWAKDRPVVAEDIAYEAWNIHSQVLVYHPKDTPPPYWGPGPLASTEPVGTMRMVIDGDAATAATRWDGDVADLDWVRHDVTSLAYQVYPGADVAVIGVGGGRDLLAAVWSGARSVVGVELNGIFVDLLRDGPLRAFCPVLDRPEVSIVHDEARSWLAGNAGRFDIVQMSLIDTWAATGAGAMTLSENGLYTIEGLGVLLDAVRPGGVVTVSRWYAPGKVSDTQRLTALAIRTLQVRGVEDPRRHVLMATSGPIVTLILGRDPLPADVIDRVGEVVGREGFGSLVIPDRPVDDPRLARIVAATDAGSLAAATADPYFDYSPPSDDRPYFFNGLKLRALGGLPPGVEIGGGPVAGNLRAQVVLLQLLLLTAALVATVVMGPLVAAGLPGMHVRSFALAAWYFGAIGLGFMLVQIPMMQRFSVYLGHPTYAVVVVLFSMILASGAGSFGSEVLPVEQRRLVPIAVPLVIGALLVATLLLVPPVLRATTTSSLPVRCLVAAAMTIVPSVPLGLCFPIGMRLVQRLSVGATAWMWGINGACGVLAAVTGALLSMTFGIDTSLMVAAALYTLLAIPASLLWSEAR